MQTMELIKTKIVINGIEKQGIVTIETETEDADFSYWDPKEIENCKTLLLQNKSQCVYVIVNIEFEGLEGFRGMDSLGQVYVRPSQYKKDVMSTIKAHGMLENAKQDLISQVLNSVEQLNKFIKGA